MANAEVFQSMQLGLETTAGVAVTASKLLTQMGGEWAPVTQQLDIRPKGIKFNTDAAIIDYWAAVSLEGMLSYTELPYVLAGLKKVSPTGAGPYVYTIVPTRAAADTVATYSAQVGSTGQPCAKWAYGFLRGFRHDYSTKECKFTAAMVGKAVPAQRIVQIQVTNGGSGYSTPPTVTFTGGGGTSAAATAVVSGGVVLGVLVTNPGSGYTSAPTIGFTGGGGTSAAATAIVSDGNIVTANGTMDYATALAVAPILPQHVSLKLKSSSYPTWGNETAVPWKGIRVSCDEVNDINRMGNQTLEWTDHVQGAPKMTLECDIEESQANASFHGVMKAGTIVYARVYADSGGTHLFETLFAGKVVGIERKAIDKVQCMTLKLSGVEDSNLGTSPMKFVLTTSVSAL